MKYIRLKTFCVFCILITSSCDLGREFWLESEKHYSTVNRLVEFEELIGKYEVLDTLTRKEFNLKDNQRLKLEITKDTTLIMHNVLLGDSARVFTDTVFKNKFIFKPRIINWKDKKYFSGDFRFKDKKNRKFGIEKDKRDSSIVISFKYSILGSGDPGLTRVLRYWRVE